MDEFIPLCSGKVISRPRLLQLLVDIRWQGEVLVVDGPLSVVIEHIFAKVRSREHLLSRTE
jgi:hypothetical protein